MGFETGVGASINGVACVADWYLQESNDAKSGFCSRGQGGEFADAGNWDWQVIAHCYGAEPQLLPGQTGTFEGATRGGSAKTGAMIVLGVRILWEVEPANLLHHYLYLGGNGQLTDGGSASDTGIPSPVSARGIGMLVDSASTAIRSAELFVQNLAAAYNDTSTNGYTKRVEGNYRATWRYNAYFATFSEAPTPGSFLAMKFYTDRASSKQWELNYGLVVGSPKVLRNADANGHAVGNSYEVTGIWSQVNDSGVAGTIIAPDETVIWA